MDIEELQKKDKEDFVTCVKTIRISKEDNKFVLDNKINLGKLVRLGLEELRK